MRGREIVREWMRTMPLHAREFPAALAFLPVLTPGEAEAALQERLVALEQRLAAVDAETEMAGKFLERVRWPRPDRACSRGRSGAAP